MEVDDLKWCYYCKGEIKYGESYFTKYFGDCEYHFHSFCWFQMNSFKYIEEIDSDIDDDCFDIDNENNFN